MKIKQLSKIKRPISVGLKVFCMLLLLVSCHSQVEKKQQSQTKPNISADGSVLTFPTIEAANYFATQTLTTSNIEVNLTTPAHVAATVAKSVENTKQNLVLFDNPELTANYTAMLQHVININQKKGIVTQREASINQRNSIIKQRENELARYQDLVEHGSATGRDIAEIKIDISNEQTNLAAAQADLTVSKIDIEDEKTAILEDESKLKLAGFNPQSLMKASVGTTWVISDVPENQVSRIREGLACELEFTSFPNEKIKGRVEDIADVVDGITRMVKVRINIPNPTGKLRAGMFATVNFGISEGNFISVSKEALVTVQGNHYVFVKKTPLIFERKEVIIGQQIDDKVLIISGLTTTDIIANTNVIQLKGLSFGY